MIRLFLFSYVFGYFIFILKNINVLEDHVLSHITYKYTKATVIAFMATVVFLLFFCWWIIYADFLFDYFKQKYK